MLESGACWLEVFTDRLTTDDLGSLGAPVELKIHPETDELLRATFKCATCGGSLAVSQCSRGTYKLNGTPTCGEMSKFGLDPTRPEDLTGWQHTTPPQGTPVIESEVTTPGT